MNNEYYLDIFTFSRYILRMPPCPSTNKIIAAAEQRFADYGYHKTTMAEIAHDAGMSVGNLYRFFKNKEAIAVACVTRQLQAKLEAGIQAAKQANDALDALRAFLMARMRTGHAQYAHTRHLFDMMALINERHRDLLLEYEDRVIDQLTEIVGRGVEQGEFTSDDPRQTAYDIHQATLRYNHPVTLKNTPLSQLEPDLKRLISLLYLGLAPRNSNQGGKS